MRLLSAGLIFSLLLCTLNSCALIPNGMTRSKRWGVGSDSLVPGPMREFRAAWIASVSNINWPSRPGLPTEIQQQEALRLLDFLKQMNFNAVILQVRPEADALYASHLEPWSYFLTGEQEKAPDPYYDPLEFWITEAHKRGMELHAWLNPYRAHHVDSKSIGEQSVVNAHPERVLKLKEGYYWMDPSLRSTQDQTAAVVNDIVKRYDVDGIHFDDYFYPYPSYNGDEDFPDDESWNDYVLNGGKMSRGDWRRDAVNTLIHRLYREIKAEKKHVKFGLSPFGIWRPGNPALVEGFDQYNKLYADAKLWLNKGWIDYFTPQLYWPVYKLNQSFPVLLGWWQEENKHQRHLWPGINVGTDARGVANNQEVVSEIMVSRGMLPKSMGLVHWNVSSLINAPSLSRELKEGAYRLPALVPPSPWLDKELPAAPDVTTTSQSDTLVVNWSSGNDETFRWVLYYRYESKWEYLVFDKDTRSAFLKTARSKGSGDAIPLKEIMVTAIGRTGNESEQKRITINPSKPE